MILKCKLWILVARCSLYWIKRKLHKLYKRAGFLRITWICLSCSGDIYNLMLSESSIVTNIIIPNLKKTCTKFWIWKQNNTLIIAIMCNLYLIGKEHKHQQYQAVKQKYNESVSSSGSRQHDVKTAGWPWVSRLTGGGWHMGLCLRHSPRRENYWIQYLLDLFWQ